MKKRLLSAVLCLSLLFSLGTTNAWAAQDSSTPVKAVPSDPIEAYETYSMTGADLSATLKKNIEDTGVPVHNDSDIQLLPVESSANGAGEALVVTNTDGPTTTKDVLLLVNDDGDAGFEKSGDVSTRAGSTVEFPPLSWDGRYVVRATAVYNQYTNSGLSYYYRPTGLYYTYQKYQSTTTINSIYVYYTCDGFWFSYPGFKDLGYEEVEWRILNEHDNPKVGTTYVQNRDFPYTNRVIAATGSPSAGQFLTFVVRVNGIQDDYTVTL